MLTEYEDFFSIIINILFMRTEYVQINPFRNSGLEKILVSYDVALITPMHPYPNQEYLLRKAVMISFGKCSQ
jgi:hypothetical protein